MFDSLYPQWLRAVPAKDGVHTLIASPRGPSSHHSININTSAHPSHRTRVRASDETGATSHRGGAFLPAPTSHLSPAVTQPDAAEGGSRTQRKLLHAPLSKTSSMAHRVSSEAFRGLASGHSLLLTPPQAQPSTHPHTHSPPHPQAHLPAEANATASWHRNSRPSLAATSSHRNSGQMTSHSQRTSVQPPGSSQCGSAQVASQSQRRSLQALTSFQRGSGQPVPSSQRTSGQWPVAAHAMRKRSFMPITATGEWVICMISISIYIYIDIIIHIYILLYMCIIYP